MAYFVFTGGGTSGHVNPSLAIAQALRQEREDLDILYIGKKGAVEEQLVPKANFSFLGIEAESFPIRPSLRLLKAMRVFWKSKKVCQKMFMQKRPDFLISTGGYVSAPVVAAAKALGIPVLVHEQNALLGRSNRLLGKKVAAFCVSYQEALKKVLNKEAYTDFLQNGKYQKGKTLYWFTGNPLRLEYLDKLSSFEKESEENENLWGTEKEALRVLVVGGSLGSRTLNKVCIDFFSKISTQAGQSLLEKKNIHMVLSSGLKLFEECKEQLKEKQLSFEEKDNAYRLVVQKEQGELCLEIHPYLHNLADYMHTADLLLCRSGASTVFELMALGKPALFVPYPYAVEDHQWHNAKAIVEKNLSYLCRDEAFQSDFLIEFLDKVEKETLHLQGEKLKKEAKLWAAKEIAQYLLSKVKI